MGRIPQAPTILEPVFPVLPGAGRLWIGGWNAVRSPPLFRASLHSALSSVHFGFQFAFTVVSFVFCAFFARAFCYFRLSSTMRAQSFTSFCSDFSRLLLYFALVFFPIHCLFCSRREVHAESEFSARFDFAVNCAGDHPVSPREWNYRQDMPVYHIAIGYVPDRSDQLVSALPGIARRLRDGQTGVALCLRLFCASRCTDGEGGIRVWF